MEPQRILVLILIFITSILVLLTLLFPGLNILTIINPKKKYFFRSKIVGDQLTISGFLKKVHININDIKKLSMGPLHLRLFLMDRGSMFSVQIDTSTETYYIFPGMFNLIAPGMNKETIDKLTSINPQISLDDHLTRYTKESLADMYINKSQIKRGLLLLLIFAVVVVIVELTN